jgi:D-lactate dehydrogenase
MATANFALPVPSTLSLSALPPSCLTLLCPLPARPAGYSLNALVDFPADDPIEVIKHLIIGSEGTLGFVSQATYNTVPGEGPGSCRES